VPEFSERYAKPKNRGWQEAQRILGKFTRLFEKPLDQIKRTDIVRILDDIIAGGAPFRANRAHACNSVILGAHSLPKLTPKAQRSRRCEAQYRSKSLIELVAEDGVEPPTHGL
jgi:hypothetical protein